MAGPPPDFVVTTPAGRNTWSQWMSNSIMRYLACSGLALAGLVLPALAHESYVPMHQATDQASAYAGMVEQEASANGVPVSLVRRVIMRESRYNPRAVSRANYGIMQIRLGTARAMGYGGSAAGLLDAATNMTYAVRYLAGAYRASGGSESRAVALYARGYYRVAKAQGFTPYAYGAAERPRS
jgi:soluble lytic murein transglycosylase-like protein